MDDPPLSFLLMLPEGEVVRVEVLTPRNGDKGISDCSILTGTNPGIRDLSGDLLRFILSRGGFEVLGVGITSELVSKLLLRLSYNFRVLEGDRGGTRRTFNSDINLAASGVKELSRESSSLPLLEKLLPRLPLLQRQSLKV